MKKLSSLGRRDCVLCIRKRRKTAAPIKSEYASPLPTPVVQTAKPDTPVITSVREAGDVKANLSGK